MRWLKLLLVILISFGIYTYRSSLCEAVLYAASLRVELAVAALLVAISLFASGLRGKHIINRAGGFMNNWDALRLPCVSAASVFSLVRVGTGIPLYYLNKRGSPLSRVATYFIMDRFFHIAVFMVLGVLLLGEFNWIPAFGLFAMAAFGFVGLRYSHKLPDRWVFRLVKDFNEELKRLVNLRSSLWLSFLALVNFVMDSLALAFLSGAGFGVSMVGVLLGMAALLASPTPAGLGVYEPVVSAHLIAHGIAGNAAIGGVLAFRLFSLWVPSFLGLYFLNREL